MKAMIFAAGLGTRLKPITDTLPKALLPLAGKPLLQWQVEKIRDAGIEDIIINVHHFPDMIMDAIRKNNGWGCRISVSDERDELLDTGGGLRNAKDLLGNEPVLACNVDILSNLDLRTLVQQYNTTALQQPSLLGLLVVSDRKTRRYLLFDDELTLHGWTNIETGEVRPVPEAALYAGHKLAFSGMQILSPAVFDYMDSLAASKGDKFSLIDLYMSLCTNTNRQPSGKPALLKAYIPKDYRMMDVGKIDQIEEAERFAESL